MKILLSTLVNNNIIVNNDDTTTASTTAKKVVPVAFNTTTSGNSCNYDDFQLPDDVGVDDEDVVVTLSSSKDDNDDDVYEKNNNYNLNDSTGSTNDDRNDSYSIDVVIATTTTTKATTTTTTANDLTVKILSPSILSQQGQISSPPAAAITKIVEETLSSDTLDGSDMYMKVQVPVLVSDSNNVVNNDIIQSDKGFVESSDHKQKEPINFSTETTKTTTTTTIASTLTNTTTTTAGNCSIFTEPCLESCTISENERQDVVLDTKLLLCTNNYCKVPSSPTTNSTTTSSDPDINTDTIVSSSTVPIPIDTKSNNCTTTATNTNNNKSYKCELSDQCVSSCAAYGRVCPCAARIAAHYACKSVQELLKNSSVFVLPTTCCTSTSTQTGTGVQEGEKVVDGTTNTNTVTNQTIGPIDLPYVNADDIIIQDKLGEGGFSCVNVCTIKNKTNNTKSNQEQHQEQYYAIKYLKKRAMCDLHTFKHGAADLAVEAVVLHTLSHPNIVQLYGVTAGSVETNVSTGKECGYFIIIDRLYGGTLETKIDLWNKQEEDFINSSSNTHTIGGGMLLNRFFSTTSHTIPSPTIPTSPLSPPPTTTTTAPHVSMDPKQHKKDVFLYRIRIAIDIALAMEYIHSLQLVYRDLKPDNIGFTKNNTIKLFDFGLTRELKQIDKVTDGSNNYRLTGNTGSRRYMSPEVAEDKPYNQSVDVYSYCILLWELLTGEKPFKNYTAAKHMNLVVLQQERPKLDSAHTKKHTSYPWPPNLIWLLKNGWSHYAVSRPSFTCIIHVLNDILNGIHTIPTSVLTINTSNGTTTTTGTSTSTPNGKRSIFGSGKNSNTTGTTTLPPTPLALTSSPMPLNKNSPITFRSTMSPLSKNHKRRTVSDATTMKATTISPRVSSPVFLSLRKTHSFVPPTSSPLSPCGKSIKPLPKLSSHSSSDGTSTRSRSWGLGLKRNDPHHQQQHYQQNHDSTTNSSKATETSAVNEKAYHACEC